MQEETLPKVAELYREILHLQVEARSLIRQHSLPDSQESEGTHNLYNGRPLLSSIDIAFDSIPIQGLYQSIICLLVKQGFGQLTDSPEIRETLSCPNAFEKAARTWYLQSSYDHTPQEQFVASSLSSVMQTIVQPFLSARSETLLPKVNYQFWRRGYCPVCGGWPDFAMLDREHGSNWLLCSRCDAVWLFLRLKCCFCNSSDSNVLGYYTDEQQLYRLYTCDSCRGYIKTIDMRQTMLDVLLPWERIVTLPLDKQAYQLGYQAKWSSLYLSLDQQGHITENQPIVDGLA